MSNPNNTDGGVMRHANVTLAQADVHGTHPFKHRENHKKLLDYLLDRLRLGKELRDAELPRLVGIDKALSGWMNKSDDDKARDRKQAETGEPQAKTMNLPLSFIHIDDMMTYYAETFAPSRGMFYQTGQPQEQDEAGQIIVKMNNDAIYAGFFREVLKGIYPALKYNKGGFRVEWGSDEGPKIESDGQGQTNVGTEVKWSGNRLKALDNYNLLIDPSVPIQDLHKDGEFAAYAEVRSHYWLKHRASRGVFHNCNEAFESSTGIATCEFYKSPPAEAQLASDNSTGTDWVSILSEAPGFTKQGGFELVHIYIRLNPTEFGLISGNKTAQSSRNRYEIWRFTVLNGEWVIAASWANNAHGHIPYYIGSVNDDSMGVSQKSPAEILGPLQDFASFLMNLHVHASRSAVWGLTVYDPTMVDFDSIRPGETSARIPVKPAGYGKDLKNHIWQQNAQLDTKQTLSDLEGLMGIINQFFPTQALPSQIASIDRAVQSQVAAVQHGANRRQQKTARLLDDSIFSKVRYSMYYNILQYMPEESQITDFYSGKPVTIDLKSMRNTNMPFVIGQGLKAIDRQMVAGMMQNIIFALIQAPQAAQNIDLLALIDYWTSMLDIDIDMKQFRIQAPVAPGGEGAMPGADPAAGAAEGITPATAPAAIAGGPIYT